jgi:hypothetical protein
VSQLKELLELSGAASTRHSGRTLLEHLMNTCDILKSLGASGEVCAAGALHSIYGTTVFGHESLSIKDRPLVRYVIGERAEQLVYLFCRAPRPFETFKNGDTYYLGTLDGDIAVTRQELQDLTLVAAANTFEQMLSSVDTPVETDTE